MHCHVRSVVKICFLLTLLYSLQPRMKFLWIHDFEHFVLKILWITKLQYRLQDKNFKVKIIMVIQESTKSIKLFTFKIFRLQLLYNYIIILSDTSSVISHYVHTGETRLKIKMLCRILPNLCVPAFAPRGLISNLYVVIIKRVGDASTVYFISSDYAQPQVLLHGLGSISVNT